MKKDKEPYNTIKLYLKISSDEKQMILDFDENVHRLAARWNTKAGSILSAISHGRKNWEKIVLQGGITENE